MYGIVLRLIWLVDDVIIWNKEPPNSPKGIIEEETL